MRHSPPSVKLQHALVYLCSRQYLGFAFQSAVFSFSDPLEIVSFDVDLSSPWWILKEVSAALKPHPTLPSPCTQNNALKGQRGRFGTALSSRSPLDAILALAQWWVLGCRWKGSCPVPFSHVQHGMLFTGEAELVLLAGDVEKLGKCWSRCLRWEAGGTCVPGHITIALILRVELKGHLSSRELSST